MFEKLLEDLELALKEYADKDFWEVAEVNGRKRNVSLLGGNPRFVAEEALRKIEEFRAKQRGN